MKLLSKCPKNADVFKCNAYDSNFICKNVKMWRKQNDWSISDALILWPYMFRAHRAQSEANKNRVTRKERREIRKTKPDNYSYRCVWLTHFWSPQIYASRSLFYFITILVRQLFSLLHVTMPYSHTETSVKKKQQQTTNDDDDDEERKREEKTYKF